MTPGPKQIVSKDNSQNKQERTLKWLLIGLTIVLFLYLGLAFLAPVLMKTGHDAFGKKIYKVYRVGCHQLAYRSFFLFGEQAVYPLEMAGLESLKSYETVTGVNPNDATFAKDLIGDEQMGYKIALCQRDVAIYSAMLLFMLVFLFNKRRIKPIPWWLWILLGIMPMAIDGVSQILSHIDCSFLSCLPARESTPLLRVLTGFLFGFFSAWFIIPIIGREELKADDNEKS